MSQVNDSGGYSLSPWKKITTGAARAGAYVIAEQIKRLRWQISGTAEPGHAGALGAKQTRRVHHSEKHQHLEEKAQCIVGGIQLFSVAKTQITHILKTMAGAEF
jgi:hypothetical protein